MLRTAIIPPKIGETESFERNRYFYGKMMDVSQFELETNYVIAKQCLLNRLVFGFGVVCGLDVLWAPGPNLNQVLITPGVAIDKWGRVIVVPARRIHTVPPDIVQAAQGQCKESPKVQVLLCYHECSTDPVPVLASECCEYECEPGVIRETYRIEFKPGPAPPVTTNCKVDCAFQGGALNYPALVQWVTSRGCPAPAKDPCVVLANLTITKVGDTEPGSPLKPDITVRQIVMTNRLWFDLLPCLLAQITTSGREG